MFAWWIQYTCFVETQRIFISANNTIIIINIINIIIIIIIIISTNEDPSLRIESSAIINVHKA